jgi:hypothetical protein
MSIQVSIPKEITEYQEKILFGLSLRQLLCLITAALLSLLNFFLFTKVFHLPRDLAEYLIIIQSIPLMALGFVKKNGFTFEKYAALFFHHHFHPQKLTYKTELNFSKIVLIKKKGFYAILTQPPPPPEVISVFLPTKKQRALRRQAAQSEIKIARRRYQQAQRTLSRSPKKIGSSHLHPATSRLPATV